MAKKKKKLLKYNQIIRHYFDGDGFDEGISRLNHDQLYDLARTIGLNHPDLTTEGLIRSLRRLWSEADTEPRAMIVNYFKDRGEIFTGSGEKKQTTDKVEKIESLLDQLSLSDDEAKAVHAHFQNERTKRISLGRIESFLQRLRLERKLQQIEKRLDIHLNEANEVEFYAPIAFAYKEESFQKIMSITTEELSYTLLEGATPQELESKCSELKAFHTARRQTEADQFLASLPNPHPYLTDEQILQSLKTMPPDNDLIYTPLNEKTLRAVFSTHFPQYSAQLMDYNLILHKEASLQIEGVDFSYEAASEIDLHDFLPALWKGEEIDFEADFAHQQSMMELGFKQELDDLINECMESSAILNLPRQEVIGFIMEELQHLHGHLHISSKTARRILFNFNSSIEKLKLKKQRETLLAQTIRDFKNLFPTARELRRKLIFHVGPTNSGKTYAAMKALEKADTGYYLAPLRLLALEGYENLKSDGVNASLITGEEQIVDEYATHISSTIEMLNFNIDVDVCVIDEVQMLDDRDRGWAWANAIIGAPAKTVYMTGSIDALPAIEALATWLNEPLEVIHFERKSPLSIMKTATPLNQIEPQTAVIAFSRKEVLQLKQQLSRNYKVSVVYGNLSPEVRREEARRFREGETEVLVATDAISMGLNLPIKTVLFSKDSKFDGEKRRTLQASEVIQIAGRAGRFGLEEKGFVGAITPAILKTVHEEFHKTLIPISLPLNVMANLEHIKLVGKILETKNLEEILRFFIKHMTFDGPFRVANLENLIEIAQYTDKYDLDLSAKYHMACAPLSTQSPYLVEVFSSYIAHMEAQKPIPFIETKLHGEFAESMESLLHVEDLVKEVSMYLWLNYRFPEIFCEPEKAKAARGHFNTYIEQTLKNALFVPRCRICTKPLALDSTHAICNSCFRKKRHFQTSAPSHNAQRKRRR